MNNKILTFLLLLVAELSFFHSLRIAKFKQSRTSMASTLGDDEFSDEIDDAFGAPVGPLPTVSSKINFGDQTPTNIQHDLWIVGAGTLGEIVADMWRKKYPDQKVHAETRSEKRHSFYNNIGVTTSLRANRNVKNELSARNVLVALPPSSSSDYVEELHLATRIWAGPLGNGRLVFTSSIGVYGESYGNVVNEKFRVDTRSKKSTMMLAAEEAITVREGCIVRLAGLYTKERGAHSYWLRGNGTVDGYGDGCLNLLHYEDAAGVSIAALEKGKPQAIYLACDDAPMSRIEICQAALDSGLFPADCKLPQFTATTGLQAKICDDSFTRKEIEWQPKYKSFGEYMVNTIGGRKTPFTLNPMINGKPRPATKRLVEEKIKQEEKKSALWLPGDEDGLL